MSHQRYPECPATGRRSRIAAVVWSGLAALGVVLCGCSSVVAHRQQPPGELGGDFSGLYTATYTLDSIGGTYAGLLAVESDGTGFRGNSRPGVVGMAIGGITGRLAEWFGGEAFRGGAFVHWSGRVERASGRVEGGTLVTPFGRFRTEGDSTAGRFELLNRAGASVGSMRLSPGDAAAHPVTELDTLAREILSEFERSLYDPGLFDRSGYRSFERRVLRAAARSRDDLEFAFAFFVAARDLPFSHVGLGRLAGERDEGPAAPSPPVLALLDGGVGVLTIPTFTVGQSAIDEAFEGVAGAGVRSLIIDLRENTGGSYVSLRVAEHLVDRQMVAGVLFSRSARERVLRGEWEGFPSAGQFQSVAALRRAIDERGAVVGEVRPARENRFRGRVIVLTSGRTASACEPLVEVLQRAGRAVVVGEPTAGAMLSARQFEVGQGWVLSLPTEDYVTGEGVRIEGVGVAPDLSADPEEAMRIAISMLGRSDGEPGDQGVARE